MGKFSDLPADIMLDIFTRLPTESTLEPKLVCKTWRDIVHHSSFSKRHTDILLRNLHSAAAVDSDKFSFILTTEDWPEDSEEFFDQFYYLEYDDEDSSLKVKKLIFNPQFVFYDILGSCNGLICITGLPNHYIVDESSTASYVAYICNPITREVVALPELDRSKYYKFVDRMAYGYGYVASNNEYKVIRLYTFKRDRKVAQVDVYTLGSGKGWRDAGKIHHHASIVGPRNAVFANGFLHWDFGHGKSEIFDLADESFVGYSQFYEHLWYTVLGGQLCGMHYSEDRKITDVLFMKEKEDKSFGWCKEFSLTGADPFNSPLARISSGTVLGYSHKRLHLYDLESSSSKMLKDFVGSIHNAIPHFNTLVSLKAFGEENTKTLEFGESKI